MAGPHAQQRRTVLVLYSERAMNPGPAVFTQGLREGLAASASPVEVETQHLGLSQLPIGNDEEVLADSLRWQYRDRLLPVVVALGVPASAFASRYGTTIWPGARTVHAAIDGAQAERAIANGDAVIPRVFDYRGTVEQAIELFPATRQVWLIAGATDDDRRWLTGAAANLAPLGDRVEVRPIAGLPWDDLLARLAQMPDDAIGVAVSFFADANGRSFIPADALAQIARSASRPVFVTQPLLVGRGSFGGRIVDVAQVGRISGRMALQLLDAPSTASMSPAELAATTRWTFDAVELRRWNIPESWLPGGSLVVNRDMAAWRRYFWPLLGTLLLVVVQGGIIGALLVQRRQRRRVEVALRESEERARASYHEVRDLAGRLITAREGERTRIARDLHDDIGQRVASLSIALSRIQREVPDTSNTKPSLALLEQQSSQISTDLRHLSHELHPGALEHLGLLEALRERCDDFTQESGVPVCLDVSESWRDVSGATALCLYRIVQEALRNVAAHAHARHVTVSLDRLGGQLTMLVSDDGRGFDPAARSRRSGLGLVSLGERVRMLGGVLGVTASPGRGTRIAVSLPAGESHAS